MNRLSSCLLSRCSRHYNARRVESTIAVIGVPFGRGQPKSGTEQAPDRLRETGLIKHLYSLHPGRVIDLGNVNLALNSLDEERDLADFDGSKAVVNNANQFLVAQMCQRVSRLVEGAIERNMTPLVLGGDHSIALGSVMGSAMAMAKKGDGCLSLLWVDAHADVNTEKTSQSGNYHGMPVSFLIREIAAAEQHLLGRKNHHHHHHHHHHQQQQLPVCLPAKNIAYIGLRDVEPAELQMLKKYSLPHYSMADVDRLGINEVVARALDRINPKNANRLHVSFDVDSVDDSLIKSTGTSVPGGLTLREALTLAETIHDSQQLVTLDVVEFNPQLGSARDAEQSASCINKIVLTFFGMSRLGNYHKRFDAQQEQE